MADLGEAVSSQQGKEVGRRKDAFSKYASGEGYQHIAC